MKQESFLSIVLIFKEKRDCCMLSIVWKLHCSLLMGWEFGTRRNGLGTLPTHYFENIKTMVLEFFQCLLIFRALLYTK